MTRDEILNQHSGNWDLCVCILEEVRVGRVMSCHVKGGLDLWIYVGHGLPKHQGDDDDDKKTPEQFELKIDIPITHTFEFLGCLPNRRALTESEDSNVSALKFSSRVLRA